MKIRIFLGGRGKVDTSSMRGGQQEVAFQVAMIVEWL